MCRDGVLREGFLRVLEGDVFILGIVILIASCEAVVSIRPSEMSL